MNDSVDGRFEQKKEVFKNMSNYNKQEFIQKSNETLWEILDQLADLPELTLAELPCDKTLFVIVDMINGFAREGLLQSPRVEALIPEITELSKKCDTLGIEKIAFADCHTDASPEFSSYPVHCKTDSTESDVVNEIRVLGGYQLIPKNSTNGFLEPVFQTWLEVHPGIDHFIVVGDCTDICILQFAVTLKTHFNRLNKQSRVIVPMDAVDTYDLGLHNGDLMHVIALFNMMGNGVEVIKKLI